MLSDLLGVKKINKDLPVPFYYQIVQVLREGIRDAVNGAEGEVVFPSEAELCKMFDVNRGTIRHALDLLEREGLIFREKGRGTFIRRHRLELDLTVLCSTTEDLQGRGWTPGSRVLEISQIVPGLHISNSLQLPKDEKVWKLYRLRLANDEPISLQWTYIPVNLAPNLDQNVITGSLYYALKYTYGIELKTADQMIRTRPATQEEAAYLGVKEGYPLFDITRTSYDAAGRPVEYLESIWRGDRYDLRVRLNSRV